MVAGEQQPPSPAQRAVPLTARAEHLGLLHRYLDPATSLAEILFGLIMTLTFTLGAGLIIEDEGRAGARELLIAVIGCNVAWGIIDGALYLVGQLFDRGRLQRLGLAIQRAPDKNAAITLISGELTPLLGNVLSLQEARVLYDRIADNILRRPYEAASITRDDWLGAFFSFVLVVLSSIPAAIPFLLIDDARVALRVSNVVLVTLLFFTGYWWAHYTTSKPWRAGLGFLVVGTLLVVAAIALGG
jgi:hypothetical protein